jgi:CubicO group peptidase (beta-lactamase class C family)
LADHAPTHRPSRRAVLATLGAAPIAAAMTSTSAATAAPARSHRPPKSVQEYGRYIADLAEQDKFSGVVLIAHRGEPVLAEAYGMADRDQSVPNTVDTSFNLASASKPFTALAITQLAQQGKLAFHDTLGTHLTGFLTELAEQVTVHHLLTHTSGMGPAPFDPSLITHSKEETWEQATTSLRQAALDFPPGARYAYSNTGMNALGEIVATVSGQPFWDYVEQHVLAKAGMTASAYYTRDQWLASRRIAHPYLTQADGSRIDGLRNLEAGTANPGGPGSNAARTFIGGGGGGAFATAPDLVRFAKALQRNELLHPVYTDLLIGSKFPVAPPPNAPATEPDPSRQAFMGYGVASGFSDYQRKIGHGGGTGGANTNWTIYLDTDWVSIILSNYDYDPQLFADILAHERQAITGQG